MSQFPDFSRGLFQLVENFTRFTKRYKQQINAIACFNFPLTYPLSCTAQQLEEKLPRQGNPESNQRQEPLRRHIEHTLQRTYRKVIQSTWSLGAENCSRYNSDNLRSDGTRGRSGWGLTPLFPQKLNTFERRVSSTFPLEVTSQHPIRPATHRPPPPHPRPFPAWKNVPPVSALNCPQQQKSKRHYKCLKQYLQTDKS